jgi:hypothetical protein
MGGVAQMIVSLTIRCDWPGCCERLTYVFGALRSWGHVPPVANVGPTFDSASLKTRQYRAM